MEERGVMVMDTRIKEEPVPLEDAKLLEAFSAGDQRGRLMKFFENAHYEEMGFTVREVIMSVSGKNVIRGLHFQNPLPQAKIVWCIRGRIYDVMVDLRKNSRTYKKWYGTELSEENGRGVYVPRGFAHGFLSLEENSYVLYLADERYSPGTDGGVRYDDPAFGIKWPLEGKPVLSEKDAKWPAFDGKNSF